MHVLLISQAYPPYPIVGALRAQKVVQALRAAGHTVSVVTERLEGERDHPRIDEPGLRVHTVAIGLQYRLRVVRLLQRRRGRAAAGVAAVGGGAAALDLPDGAAAAGGGPLGVLRRLVLALLWLPDDEQRFIRPTLRAAREIVPSGVDLIYSTAPSFSSHVAALLLKRRYGIRWVAEFRDPWTDQRDASRPGAIGLVERAHRWIERRCLLAADRIVTVTEGARASLAAKLPEAQRDKVLLALNGIDAIAAVEGRRPGPYRIVYAGTFYHNRDPRRFLAALAALRAELGLTPADVRVDFAGHCRTYDDVSVEDEVARHGLQDVVHFHDWMSHDAMQRMLRDADLLFLIALGQPLQVPNKVFDYLGTRRRILAVVDAGGESERMVRSVGGHQIVAVPAGGEATLEAMTAALRAALEAHRNAGPVAAVGDVARLEEWLASRQMRHLVDAIAT